MTRKKPPVPLTRGMYRAYEHLACVNLDAANREKDALERGRLLDLARMFAKKIGRAVERTLTEREKVDRLMDEAANRGRR